MPAKLPFPIRRHPSLQWVRKRPFASRVSDGGAASFISIMLSVRRSSTALAGAA
jgi:hypothetical protein